MIGCGRCESVFICTPAMVVAVESGNADDCALKAICARENEVGLVARLGWAELGAE